MGLPQHRSSSSDGYALILQAISEVKVLVNGLDERVRALEQATITQSVMSTQKLEAAFRRLDEHSTSIQFMRAELDRRVQEREVCTDDLTRRMEKVETITAIVRWIGAGLGVLLGGFLWAIFTQQVQIIIK